MARILVAEDREDVAAMLRLFLERMGHEIETVGDGDAAVGRFAAGDFALVLMDAAMPEADGFTAARRIRAQDEETPILMVTAYNDTMTKAHARRSGIDHVIFKPFDPDELTEAVEYLLRNGRPV